MSFRNEDEIKTFSDTQKIKECVAIKPSLQERLKAGGGEMPDRNPDHNRNPETQGALKMSLLATAQNQPRKKK